MTKMITFGTAPPIAIQRRRGRCYGPEHDAGAQSSKRERQQVPKSSLGRDKHTGRIRRWPQLPTSDAASVVIYHFTQIDDGSLNLLVLAELPVRRLQVSKIDAAELLVFTAERPWIIHSGLNEVIKIDVLDLESLDHVGAAGLQQLGDLLLIAISIELCLHRTGSYCHLAERQRRGKNFDKK